ncbi:sodium/solute symporter [Actinoallomurus rhizosphaericola]|uniref:sodium/solute symporter n=1 Tax=Actinoallomurus rhizosphaericola TaxID=2952536 RepID=UPI0020933238|nr:cation acetate symporter [Actinoallomurus rhizosphaericola]MCO5996534.1 cation acetate symporter [Actinoallomurus rhizosphaericola]
MITMLAMALLIASLAIVPARGRPAQASGLYTAAREVSPWWNASAISGEYVSAAAFLGMAGLVLAYGADMLWLPIGAAAGHVVLLALVTAPLRRSGAYTVSDFAEWRLGSRRARRAVSTCVLVIGWFYLLPQFQGAGVTLSVISGLPVWTGWLVVVAAVVVLVLPGGVRSITGVQAVQFWLKLTAVTIPALVFIAVWRLQNDADAARPPYFHRDTTVTADTSAGIHLTTPVAVAVTGVLDDRRHHGERLRLTAGRHRVRAGTRIRFPAGAPVPHTSRIALLRGDRWATPFAGGREHPLAATYSVLLATILGTMGLPQITVRFYTNACGRTARRTAGLVVLMLAVFSLFPALFGTLGRLYTPELLMTGETDATLLLLPHRIVPGVTGDLLTALVATGAFAAFTSTSCGVVVAVSGSIAQGLGGGARGFRTAVLVAVAVPLLVAPWACSPQSAALVTVAFAVAASSLSPLLVLGVWWRRLTPAAATAGILAGGVPATAAGLARVLGDPGPGSGWLGTLVEQPAIVTVPLAFAVTVAVSLLTPGRVPERTERAMARMHLPEGLGPDGPG